MTDPDVVPHATRGVRASGAIVGSGLFLALAWTFVAGNSTKIPVFVTLAVLAIGVFNVARPWFLFVRLTGSGFVIRSWFKTYTFDRGEVESIDMMYVYAMGVGAGVGFIPFVGAVRMLKVATTDGRITMLACTLGKRNAVLRLARRLRVQVGLSSAHSTLAD